MNDVDTAAIYTDKAMSIKRGALMELLAAVTQNKSTNPDLWKLHINACLDKLDENLYKLVLADLITEARIDELQMLPVMRKGLHTLEGEIDIILLDTVKQRIKRLSSQLNGGEGEL